MDAYEYARLQAVESAVKAELEKPGAVTRKELAAALSAQPSEPPPAPGPEIDPITPTVEETV